MSPVEVRTVVRPYGSALPLAFLCFGVGMLVLAGLSLGWLRGPDVRTAGIILAAFVFPLEFLTCVIAFLARDTAVAASLGLFSTSWLALGLVDIVSAPGQTSAAVGLYLVGFTVTIAAMAVVALPVRPLIGLLMLGSALRSLLSGIYQLGGAVGFDAAAGIAAMVVFVGAAYLGLAFALEDTRRRVVLPTLRRGAAAKALDGEPADQLGGLPDEAGVRAQL